VCEFMRSALESLVRALEIAPLSAIRTLEVLPKQEREQVLYRWNETAREFPQDKCVHELFEEQVKKRPDAVAVVFEEASLSYGELNMRANRLAHYLRRVGVKPDSRVAICVERGLEMVVAVMGVLKAGGAYVPLDPAYPAERLRFMVEDSEPVVVLSEKRLEGLVGEIRGGAAVVELDNEGGDWQQEEGMCRSIRRTRKNGCSTCWRIVHQSYC